MPDTCPADVLANGQGGDFSLVAGDFEEIYGGEAEAGGAGEQKQKGQWSAVVTCFFIDTVRPGPGILSKRSSDTKADLATCGM